MISRMGRLRWSISTSILTTAGPGPRRYEKGSAPWKPDGTAGPRNCGRILAASLAERLIGGIRGRGGALDGSMTLEFGRAPTPGESGSPCQNQLYFPFPL